MTHSVLVVIAVILAVSATAVGPDASAQPTAPALSPTPPIPPLPYGQPDSTGSSSPEWLVWRAFHDSLDFYSRAAPTGVEDLLDMRWAIRGSEAEAFMTAGKEYLESLSAIDEDARAEIRRRYQRNPQRTLPVPDSGASQSDARVVVPPIVIPPGPGLLAGRADDGRDIREAAAQDGLIAAVERQRTAQVRVHIERLRRIIGPERLFGLQEALQREVAPNVAVVTTAVPASPAPGATARGALDSLDPR